MEQHLCIFQITFKFTEVPRKIRRSLIDQSEYHVGALYTLVFNSSNSQLTNETREEIPTQLVSLITNIVSVQQHCGHVTQSRPHQQA